MGGAFEAHPYKVDPGAVMAAHGRDRAGEPAQIRAFHSNLTVRSQFREDFAAGFRSQWRT